MISKLFLVTLLTCFFISGARWTDPVALIRLSNNRLTDTCVDSNDHTLILFQAFDSNELQALTYASYDSSIKKIRNVMTNKGSKNGYPKSKIVCRKNADNDVMVFSVTVASPNGAGILAEASRDGIFVEKYRKEGIDAGSLLFMNFTERIVLFMATSSKSLWFVTRPPGSEIFSSEQSIYNNDSFAISDITSAASKKYNELLWHVAVRVEENIYYFLGENNGVRWEGPRVLEKVKVKDDTFFQISFISNYDLSSTIFLAYLNFESVNLYLTWTSNNGETWAKPDGTLLTYNTFYPYGFLYTIDGKPALFLSDYGGNYAIAKSWTDNQIKYSRGKSPVIAPVYTPQVSPSSLLQGIGHDHKNHDWVSSTNQTDQSLLEDMRG